MNFNYILFAPYPNERAYSLQITEQINALAKTNVRTRIFSFKRRIKFKNRYLAYLAFLSKCIYLLIKIILARHLRDARILMRDVRFVPIIKFLYPRSKIYLEIHYLEGSRNTAKYLEYISTKVVKVIFLTETARSKFNLPNSLALHDGTICGKCQFNSALPYSETANNVITQLGAAVSKPKIGYFGSFSTLNQSKGVREFSIFHSGNTLLKEFDFHFIGGNELEVEELNLSTSSNFLFFTRVSHREALALMGKYDCLLLLSTDSEFSEVYSSPLKLFDYLNSNRRIISASLDPIKEISSKLKDGIEFVDLFDQQELAKAIRRATRKGQAQPEYKSIVQQYCWCSRARHLKNILESS